MKVAYNPQERKRVIWETKKAVRKHWRTKRLSLELGHWDCGLRPTRGGEDKTEGWWILRTCSRILCLREAQTRAW